MSVKDLSSWIIGEIGSWFVRINPLVDCLSL